MIKALLVDDEYLAIDNLKILLDNLDNEVEVIAEAGNILDAVKKYNSLQPNVVFLDVNMPNGTGFDFLECVDFSKTKVVFVTAFDNFAIKAIKYQVFDYLVKPIDLDLLEQTVLRLEESLSAHSTENKNIEDTEQKVSFSTSEEIVYVKLSDIYYCESDNSYCTIYTKNNDQIVISSSLQKLQERLNNDFIRVHQSYLINQNEITKYLKLENKVLLSNNVKIPVSKSNKKVLLDIIG